MGRRERLQKRKIYEPETLDMIRFINGNDLASLLLIRSDFKKQWLGIILEIK